jgi:hypothetical protein
VTDQGPIRALRRIKALHSAVWLLFAAGTLAVPVFARSDRFDLALTSAALVFVEVLVLAVNRWQCPLTGVAARYTADRRANFDIYLPEWLARHNKTLFGSLYLGGLLYTWLRWIG